MRSDSLVVSLLKEVAVGSSRDRKCTCSDPFNIEVTGDRTSSSTCIRGSVVSVSSSGDRCAGGVDSRTGSLNVGCRERIRVAFLVDMRFTVSMEGILNESVSDRPVTMRGADDDSGDIGQFAESLNGIAISISGSLRRS